MSWTAPPTFVSGAVLTAAQMNILGGDISFLAGTQANYIATSQTTASTTYGDLATVGPQVTVTVGANCLVILTCSGSNNSAGDGAWMSFASTGANGLSAIDANGLESSVFTMNQGVQCSIVSPVSGLTAGSTTFTAKYRASGGGTAAFANRSIIVLPLP